jgi:hypothetical protein
LEIFGKYPVFLNSRKFRKNSLEISLEAKTGDFGSKTEVSEHSELTKYLEFVLFRTFQKLQKYDVKIKL